jgi:ADP-ribose pyrophosphatase YjhB (NUDIX family)
VGAILLNRGRVLLVERAKSPFRGYWSLPGGVLETGELLEEGVRREVREETGLVVRPLRVVEIFERIIRNPEGRNREGAGRDAQGRVEYHYVLIDYLCRVTGGTLEPADDVSRAEWVDRRELSRYKITEGTLPVIEKAFRESGRP